MSEFGSIDDLQKPSSDPASAGSGLQVASDAVAGALKKKMGEVKLKEKEEQTKRKAATIGFPHISLEKFPITHQALRQVPLEQAQELGLVCFYASESQLRFGALDPDQEAITELVQTAEQRMHAKAQLYIVSQQSLDHVLDLYKTLPNIKPVSKDVEVTAADLEKVQVSVTDLKSLQKVLDEATTTDSVVAILGAALQLDASDVHVEAEEGKIVVRLRLDGVLHDAAVMPKEMYRKLVARIKLISSLKINVTSKPQDGRFTIKLDQSEVDVRVSTIPTVYGESIVMRLLVQDREQFSLEHLGMQATVLEGLQREISRPNGMIITTGPTGSGKTTTLYAAMQVLNKPGVKIITLEDPVEYKMEGINQSQIDISKDYTFAKGLRSMLRQDPDIAMVGEIRDLETAEIAVQSALTGHLIMSTLHTNSAAGAIPRFLSMGVQPFLLAPALNAIMGQRLVRKLSPEAKVEATLSPEQQKLVEEQIAAMPEPYRSEAQSKPMTFYTAPEYLEDGSLGYKGRVGIYELFVIDDTIEKQILAGNVSEYDMEKAAKEQGMLTMVQDGILKALEGVTSIEEVLRVIE